MNNKRILGHVLLWIGFLTGAFVAVRQADIVEEPATAMESSEPSPDPQENSGDPGDADSDDTVAEDVATEDSAAEADASEQEDSDGDDIASLETDTGTEPQVDDQAVQAKVAKSPWSAINWFAYGAGLTCALAGVVLLRMTAKSSAPGEDAEKKGSLSDLITTLDRLQATVDGWIAQFDDIFVYDFHGKIDTEVSDDFGTFADLRELMIPAYGLDHYALIMTEFALAERTINRVWCASADGYIDEVRESLARASAHLTDARRQWDVAAEEKAAKDEAEAQASIPEDPYAAS